MSAPTISLKGKNWIRTATLVVASSQTLVDSKASGYDLSALQFRFTVKSGDTETPNTLLVRIYNLSDQTQKKILAEYDVVTLQAGYVNSTSAIIFQGSIKQFRHGRENETDTYLEIAASDADLAYNFGFVNTTFGPGSTGLDVVKAAAAAMGVSVDPASTEIVSTGGIIYPRGRVASGLARVFLRQIGETLGARWSIQQGVLTFIPLGSYVEGVSTILNAQTGLIGVPESTEQGITVRSLLNAEYQIGRKLQIANDLINQTAVKGAFFPDYKSVPYFASVTDDGIYRILTLDHSGDTRGNDWYSDMVCLAIDPSASMSSGVQEYP